MNIHSLTTTDKSMSNFITISFDMLSLKIRREESFDFYVTLLRLRFDPLYMLLLCTFPHWLCLSGKDFLIFRSSLVSTSIKICPETYL